ncbi:NUDIX hydrolase [Massilia arenosa]|uniref:NUDIX hydrolase n=1 Tax=Zemynaea arenosa TaxID=2561931 RepID=A0A4Y9SKG7_9BURK|nr:NUDIX hydrolase [Massilia arenosa]TFW21765.1 NUDIX hydrolase [Massilia arenosa]
MTRHPHSDHLGQPVVLRRPSTPTALPAWSAAEAIATVVPGGALPATLNGIPFKAWAGVPRDDAGWHEVTGQAAIAEPPYHCPAGQHAAAGAVIVEEDGRVWLVAPSNQFGGYEATFPKGRVDPGASLQATAIREAYEESGLQVAIVAHLLDCARSQTYTRYYVARRVGGSPALMGWESQAVHLVPLEQLPQIAWHANDKVVIAALRAHLVC